MPELPEVETVKRTLEPCLSGKTIDSVSVFMPKIIQEPALEQFELILAGKKITGVDRRGKYLLINLSEGYLLIVHLRMTGRLLYVRKDAPVEKHTHVIFSLEGSHDLRFVDQRQFGWMYLVRNNQLNKAGGLAGLGPEPLSPELTPEMLAAMLAGKNTKMKTLLLDQRFLAGIGNIYADEILFAAKLHPQRTASSLDQVEIERLYRCIREVLAAGIRNRGTTIRDYVDGGGQIGEHQHHLGVYGREGRACKDCGQPVERMRMSGRSTFHCSRCQN
ncbi:MAG: bifunctional DNA-formamidopyrimidine glycosylase/DNA-(apurinic or apyrimidinic site) lyase [Bacillota bacterium]